MSDAVSNREPSSLVIRVNDDVHRLRTLITDAGPHNWNVLSGEDTVTITNFLGTSADISALMHILRSWVDNSATADLAIIFHDQVLSIGREEYSAHTRSNVTRLGLQLLELIGSETQLYVSNTETVISRLGVVTADIEISESREIPRTHQRSIGASSDSLAADRDNATPVVPVTVYLADGRQHERVIDAIEHWLSGAGLDITERSVPIISSYWQRMKARMKTLAGSANGRAVATAAASAADFKLQKQGADVTKTLLDGVSSLIEALKPEERAVIRVGMVLVVKNSTVGLAVIQLTKEQTLILDNRPELLTMPDSILGELGTVVVSQSPMTASLREIG